MSKAGHSLEKQMNGFVCFSAGTVQCIPYHTRSRASGTVGSLEPFVELTDLFHVLEVCAIVNVGLGSLAVGGALGARAGRASLMTTANLPPRAGSGGRSATARQERSRGRRCARGGGGRVSLKVVVYPRCRDAVRVKQLAFGEFELAFGTGELGKVECGKSECGRRGGDAFERATTIGATGASNVRSDSLEGSLWGSLRRREPR